MGLTKWRDRYYAESRVVDDGKALRLAKERQEGKLKRWSVECGNKEAAQNYEAKVRSRVQDHSDDTRVDGLTSPQV